MASARLRFPRHASNLAMNSSDRRNVRAGSRPVGFRPEPGRGPPCFFGVAFSIELVLPFSSLNIKRAAVARQRRRLNKANRLRSTRPTNPTTESELIRRRLANVGMRLERLNEGFRLMYGHHVL
jgi:hypothetical protein